MMDGDYWEDIIDEDYWEATVIWKIRKIDIKRPQL